MLINTLNSISTYKQKIVGLTENQVKVSLRSLNQDQINPIAQHRSKYTVTTKIY